MKKGFYIAISILSVLSGCITANAEVAPQKKMTLVQTPFGLRPQQCVHEHPSGTRIRETTNGVEVISPEGFMKNYPVLKECLEYDKRWKREHINAIRKSKNGKAVPDGWIDNAQWYPPKPVTSITGNYTVPNDPAAGKKSYWLYYFMGTENFQSDVDVSILQPVLAWSSLGWTFASWNCCPQGQVHVAKAVNASANTIVKASMKKQCDTWVIDSEAAGQHSTLQVDAINRIFNWTDATLEIYYVKDCSYFPTLPIQYNQMIIETTGGVATPKWSASGTTACSGKTTILNPAYITIKHN